MPQELLTKQGSPFFYWEFDSENNWLYLNWKGYISQENGIKATELLLELMETNHYAYVLNDNREINGPWGAGESGNDWLQQTFFPKVATAGLRYFAHILAPGIASALMAQDLQRRLNGILTMQIFGEAEKARSWLKEMQRQATPPAEA